MTATLCTTHGVPTNTKCRCPLYMPGGDCTPTPDPSHLTDRDMEQLRHDHGAAAGRMETARRPTRVGTVLWSQGYRQAWWDAFHYILTQQTGWDTLTEAEAILELRKNTASIYYPQFRDDPRIWVDCPRDGRVTVGVEGFCDACGYPFDDSPTIKEWD